MHPRITRLALLAALLITALPPATGCAQDSGDVRLAYVHADTVTLAGADGSPVTTTGPAFSYGQGARLFWTADGRTLYIARDDGLYATGPGGAAAAQVPGSYGRTLAVAQDRSALYYLESADPQPVEEGIVSFPVYAIPTDQMQGGRGRLAGYFGRFQAGATRADLTFAAALYARDGGLLNTGRPNLWPTYGVNLFGTCCFPNPGLGMLHVGLGEYSVFDGTFLPGAAAASSTRTHLAGPTTGGTIRVIDLITAGTRDYTLEVAGGLGDVERITWSPDDTALYILARFNPGAPLALDIEPPFPVDTRSANIVLYRLNLVTEQVRELAWRPDVYGVSSLAATDRYVFAAVVEPNFALVNALNSGQVAADALSTDPALAAYMPPTHLWRVDIETGEVLDVLDDVWGVVARPIR
ncbi:MAG: hypothetical protein JXJ20_08695 [Anaerolineae bacterium]|nr:hypothetical protein [Anaerolineae bacterium]